MKFLVAELIFHDNTWEAIGLYDSLLDAKAAVLKGKNNSH